MMDEVKYESVIGWWWWFHGSITSNVHNQKSTINKSIMNIPLLCLALALTLFLLPFVIISQSVNCSLCESEDEGKDELATPQDLAAIFQFGINGTTTCGDA